MVKAQAPARAPSAAASLAWGDRASTPSTSSARQDRSESSANRTNSAVRVRRPASSKASLGPPFTV